MKLGGKGGRARVARLLSRRLREFVRTPLRGGDETYEQAHRRIRESHASVLRDHLTPDLSPHLDCEPDSIGTFIQTQNLHLIFGG